MMWYWVLFVVVLLFGFVVFRGAPYVPSKKKYLREAFTELYPLSGNDLLVDIGSGDGVVLREAARRKAQAVGYELNPILVFISRFISRHDPRVQVKLADFWHVALPAKTTVVYVFGESRDIDKMANKIQKEANRLKRPLFFISYAFKVKDVELVASTQTHFLYRLDPND